MFFSNTTLSDEIKIIKGNKFTDENAIISIIKEKPQDISEEYSNYLLKTLDNSNLFKNVNIKIDDKYIISILMNLQI